MVDKLIDKFLLKSKEIKYYLLLIKNVYYISIEHKIERFSNKKNFKIFSNYYWGYCSYSNRINSINWDTLK